MTDLNFSQQLPFIIDHEMHRTRVNIEE